MTGGAFLEYEERDRLNDIVSGLPIFTLPPKWPLPGLF